MAHAPSSGGVGRHGTRGERAREELITYVPGPAGAVVGLALVVVAGEAGTRLAGAELGVAGVGLEIDPGVTPPAGAAIGVGLAHAGALEAVDGAALASIAGVVAIAGAAHGCR